MRSMIGLAINVYRRTPLHPHLGQQLAGLLARVSRRAGGPFEHQVGNFRMNIDLEQRIDAKIYFAGAWEPDTVATIRQLVPRDGVAVDVGANIGFISLVLASQVGPGGRVIAFEPTNWTYRRLCANVALNPRMPIVTVQSGLSDRERVCEEADIPYGYRLDGKVVTERQPIRMTTLDAYLAEHPLERLDFIKCDTDGMEEEVFTGGLETLKRFRPAMHFELYQGLATDKAAAGERLLRLLDSLGYSFFREGTLQPIDNLQAVLNEIRPGHHAANVVAIAR
jgi:FkbM family methyltransferase